MSNAMGINPSSFKKAFISGNKPYVIPKGMSAGQSRYQVLKNSLGNFNVHIVPNKQVIFKNSQENRDTIETFEGDSAPKKGVYFLRVDGSGQLVDIGNIYKSSVFGGGYGVETGSGLSPAEMTARAESLQCFYNAALAKTPRLKPQEVTMAVLKATSGMCFTGRTTLAAAADISAEWHASSYFVAKKLIKTGYINTNYTFHRDDSVMKTVYAVKSRAYNNMGFKVLSDDKWNPGDIWAVKKGTNIAEVFANADTSIKAVNKVVQQVFDDKTIIAISLKMIKKENLLKLSKMNHSKNPKKTESYELEGFKLSGAKGFFSSKASTIIGSNGVKLDMRNKGLTDPPTIEIILSTARGGGAGYDVATIPAAVRFLGQHNIPNNRSQKLIDAAIMQGNETSINSFWENVKTVQESSLNKDGRNLSLTEGEFKKQVKEQPQDRIHAKYAQAAVFAALARAPDDNARNNWIDYIINYAGSTLTESSVYLKAYQ